ncbi:hypothetical protein [Nisaea sp.]|uniref:hypothetical protein n=1 Tax=Nisaea sp. TaxID=2024842 RepID=UPI002B2715E0|nr:hypothetical protein [Nisaea sp.]
MVAAAIVVTQGGSAYSAGKNSTTITTLKACEAAITDTQEARAGNPDLGPKSAAAFDDLLELAAQRCKDGAYQYADDLLIIARGMVASE